jgi:hypothetical protein
MATKRGLKMDGVLVKKLNAVDGFSASQSNVTTAEHNTAMFEYERAKSIPNKLKSLVSFWADSSVNYKDDNDSDRVILTGVKAAFILKFHENLKSLSEPLRDSNAARKCQEFAEKYFIAVAAKPNLRWAIFQDDEESLIELVLHYRSAKRQVTITFNSTDQVGIERLDEHMHKVDSVCSFSHDNTLRNVLAWLIHR